MDGIFFDGQQEGEKIFYVVTPHSIPSIALLILTGVTCTVFFFILVVLAGIVPFYTFFFRSVAIMLGGIVLGGGIYWQWMRYTKTKTYITNRRIIRFEAMNPFLVTKRSLFWNEVLKAKCYTPTFFSRFLNIGTLQVAPIAAEGEDITITSAEYFEDLANYIDKILYIYKQSPHEISLIRSFVPKKKGSRG